MWFLFKEEHGWSKPFYLEAAKLRVMQLWRLYATDAVQSSFD
jgi:hypothetical protein